MVRRNIPTWTVIPGLVVLAVFIAGFFHHTDAQPAGHVASPVAQSVTLRKSFEPAGFAPCAEVSDRNEAGDFAMNGALAPSHLYHRTADFSCKVESVVTAYTAMNGDLKKDFGGRITSMEITGNDDGRQGVIQCAVSVDKFNDFVTYVRKKGKIVSERIAATAKPPGRGSDRDEDAIDARELSLVTVRIMDEKVATQIGESRGLLASSFARSMSHFLSGLAVLVEAAGWIAPYMLILVLFIAPIAMVRRFRRQPAEVGAQLVR